MRRAEMLGGELGALEIEAELLASELEAPADHPCIGTGARHAFAPGRIVILAAAHLADQLEHMAIAVGVVRHQPFAEQVAHLRSEEHTSELQSRPHLVCRLLLEKKNN